MNRIRKILLVLLLMICAIGCAKTTDPAAQMVMDQINEMKESDSYTLADIEKAKERYNSLTDDQKKQVENYADLLTLEDEYYEQLEEYLASEEYKSTHYFDSDFLRVSEVVTYSCIETIDESKRTVLVEVKEASKTFEEYSAYLEKNFEKKWNGNYYEYYDTRGNTVIFAGHSNDVALAFNQK